MLARVLLVACCLSSLSACDVVSVARVGDDGAGSAASAPPEGWESLEDEGSATRLYYQFVDGRGRVRFVERLEDVPEPLRGSVGFVEMDVPPPLTPADAARAREAQRQGRPTAVASADPSGAPIVLYSAEWCGACRKAKRYLDRRGVDYEERDIDVPRHADELVRKTGRRAVPVIVVEGRVLTGFSREGYDALIDAA